MIINAGKKIRIEEAAELLNSSPYLIRRAIKGYWESYKHLLILHYGTSRPHKGSRDSTREHVCAECGKMFSGHHNRKYCTDKCLNKAHTRAKLEADLGSAVCVVCDNEYTINHINKNNTNGVCSVACLNISRSIAGKDIPVEDIEKHILETSHQPSLRSAAEHFGTTGPFIQARITPKYGSWRKAVEAIRGTYVSTENRNGVGLTASYLFERLQQAGIKGTQEYEFEDMEMPKTGRRYRYDFYSAEHRVIIEFHGRQHYEYVPFFHKTYDRFERSLEIDKYKKEFAEAKGLHLIEWRYDTPINDETILELINLIQVIPR